MIVEKLPKIFKDAIPIVNTLIKAGYEAYFVGGSVRDLLLGRPIHDVDIATNAYPAEIKKQFVHTVDTGIQHGTVTVIEDESSYEITTFRTESTYQDYRRPDHVDFVQNLDEDLKRRDFTINALAMKPDGEIIDLFGGLDDLDKGLIKAVGNPHERFHEDALRMMRAVRFVSQLGFKLEDQTKEAITSNSPLLEKIAIERIREELIKLGLGKASDVGMKYFVETNLVDHVPYLAGTGTLLKTYQSLAFFPTVEENFWAVLLILAKIPNDKLRKFLKDWKNSNELIRQTISVIEFFDLISESDPKNRQLFEYGQKTIVMAVDLAHILGVEVNGVVLIDRYNNLQIKNSHELAVDGSYLIQLLSMKAGPKVGRLLSKITDAVLENKVENTVKSITKYVQNDLGMI